MRARIVGVVESVAMSGLDTDPRPAFYVALAQAVEGHFLNWGMDVVVRGARPESEPEIRTAVREVFPDAAVFRVSTMESLISESVADRRLQLLVLGLFAAMALVLTMVGVGGVLLLVVRHRMRELGVRLALGARTEAIWWLVQRRGLALAGLGAAIGLVAAFLLSRTVGALVHGVSVRDPVAFLAAPTILIAAAFGAAALPALKAMRIDPARTLKED
jgi:ABC-type antimicrobial peptide transport system permease subunit